MNRSHKIAQRPRQDWIKIFLLPFKVYSVAGILVFLCWFRFYHQLHLHDHHTYVQFGDILMKGYGISTVVLLFASLIQVIKSKPASSCFVFGIFDFVIACSIVATYPA